MTAIASTEAGKPGCGAAVRGKRTTNYSEKALAALGRPVHPCHIMPMATKRIPRPGAPIALANLIGDIPAGQVVRSINALPSQNSNPVMGSLWEIDKLVIGV